MHYRQSAKEMAKTERDLTLLYSHTGAVLYIHVNCLYPEGKKFLYPSVSRKLQLRTRSLGLPPLSQGDEAQSSLMSTFNEMVPRLSRQTFPGCKIGKRLM